MATQIKGIIAAMVTSMHDDESLNFEEIKNQVNRQIAAGVDGVFCLGTNGEAYIQSEDEKLRVIETVVKAADGRVPVYAGTGMPGTADTIRLSKKAKELGVNVLSVISPYFAAISQDELYNHYAELASAVDLPIVMYNMPARTGNNINPDTAARLSKIPNIAGIKDSSGNFDNMKQYIELTDPESFSVLSGNDALILKTLENGGKGGITASSPYGLCVNRNDTLIPGKMLYGHQGMSDGIAANVYFDPETRFVFTFISNGCNNNMDNRVCAVSRRLLTLMWEAYGE